MDKSDLMKRYEAETGEILDIDHLSADANGSWYGYIEELESELRGLKLLNKWSKEELIQCQAKAAAYDRVMSGGKKTLKEWANIFGKPVVDSDGTILVFSSVPSYEGGYSQEGEFVDEWVGDVIAHIDCEYEGEWIDDVTLPDGWEEQS